MSYTLSKSNKTLATINGLGANYGLTLTETDMVFLAQRQEEALENSGRVDFSDGPLREIAREFCDSAFIQQEDYAETLAALTDCFYAAKTESGETVSDAELLGWMKQHFDEDCEGSMEALTDKILQICRDMRLGGIVCES